MTVTCAVSWLSGFYDFPLQRTRIPTAYGDESAVVGKEPYIHDMRTVTLHNFGLSL